MTWGLTEFTVNMAGCRFTVRPCEATTEGAERVLRSEPRLLVTERHTLRNPFILEVSSEYVTIEALQ